MCYQCTSDVFTPLLYNLVTVVRGPGCFEIRSLEVEEFLDTGSSSH